MNKFGGFKGSGLPTYNEAIITKTMQEVRIEKPMEQNREYQHRA